MNKVCQNCHLDEGDIRAEGIKDYALFNSAERLCRRCAITAGWEKPEPKKYAANEAIVSVNDRAIQSYGIPASPPPEVSVIYVDVDQLIRNGADIYVDGQKIPGVSGPQWLTKDEVEVCKAYADEVWTPSPALTALRDEMSQTVQKAIAKAFQDCAGMTATEVAVAWLDHYFGAGR